MLAKNYTQVRQIEMEIYTLAKKIRDNRTNPDQAERDADKLDILLDQLDSLEGRSMGRPIVIPNLLRKLSWSKD